MNLIRYWYKYTNKVKFRKLKQEESNVRNAGKYKRVFSAVIDDIQAKIESQKVLNFRHSGHLGDIIYSLPVIKALAEGHTCNLYITADKPMTGEYYKHPSGNVMLSKNIISKLLPLLKTQKYLAVADYYVDQTIDIDLDLFRELPINFSFLSHRWYFHIAGVQPDLTQNYLQVDQHPVIKDQVVIVRSFRARNHFVDYSFLSSYSDLLFIGTHDEYVDMKLVVPNLQFYDVSDFYEMAQIIKSSKMFLGNQSFAYALADGLKVPRLLEANPAFPVVFPLGDHAYDFYFQQHFEYFFKKLYYAKAVNAVD